jgi:hypothetical protein
VPKFTMQRTLVILAIVALTEFCPAATIILNPSFEDSDMSSWTRTALSGIRPWGRGSASPQDGDWYVFAPDEASISQSFVSILGGEVNQFSFWVDRPTTANMFVELTYADGTSSGQVSIDGSTGPGWGLFDAKPLIDATKMLDGFTVTKLGTGSARLDNFQLTVVPEPTTSALLILGTTLIIKRKRHNKTRRGNPYQPSSFDDLT